MRCTIALGMNKVSHRTILHPLTMVIDVTQAYSVYAAPSHPFDGIRGYVSEAQKV
jgi:hypothetical protein